MKHGKHIDPFGYIRWYYKNQLHRVDGPANISPNGDESWWQFDNLHRLDGPAVITSLCREWFQNGQLHREDGPAIEYTNGESWWYHWGKIHRTDGPAITWKDGSCEWYINDKRVANTTLGFQNYLIQQNLNHII